MKCTAALSALCLLLALSCAPRTPLPDSSHSKTPPSAIPVVSDQKSGFCLVNGLTLWDFTGTQQKAVGTLQIGEKVALPGKRMTAAVSGKDRAFLEIQREAGLRGWAREEFIASDSILGAVTAEPVVLYSQPRNTGATGRTLPFLTVFAIRRDSAAQSFVRISVYDPDGQAVRRDVFLRNEGISSRVEDVETAILCRLASDTANRTQREAYLKSALADYPASAFSERVREMLGGAAPAPDDPAGSEEVGGTLAATEDRVSVLSSPDDTAGTVVGSLYKGQVVEVQEKTRTRTRIGSLSAPWYRIKDPSGWVFGAFLAAPP